MNNQKPADRIRDAREAIRQAEEEIRRCQHTPGEPFYNPEKKMEGYGLKTVGQGSDVWSEYTGYQEVLVPRWTRRCTKCGNEEHTYEQEPIVVGQQPKFPKK